MFTLGIRPFIRPFLCTLIWVVPTLTTQAGLSLALKVRNLFFCPFYDTVRKQDEYVQWSCPKCCHCIRLDSTLAVIQISVLAGKCQISHRNEDKLSEMLHCLCCNLGYIAEEALAEPLPLLSVRTVLQLLLHVLLYLEEAPVKTSCLIADHCRIPSRLLPSSQESLVRYVVMQMG